MGFYIILIAALYAYLQFKVLPVLCYKIGKKKGLPRWGAVLCAVAGFLVLAVPVWHKELPALIVYNRLKKECGTVIHKPFEQWVRENPGVLETLERNDKLIEMKKKMGEAYPNRHVGYNGYRFALTAELRSHGEQRIGWYMGGKSYVGERTEKAVDILYDIQKKEVLAEKTVVGYGPPWGADWGQGPTWYHGRAKPGQRLYGYDVGTYYEYFVHKEKK